MSKVGGMVVTSKKPAPLFITGDPDTDGLLNADPLALLIGMLLSSRCRWSGPSGGRPA